MIGSAFIILSSMAMPLLVGIKDTPTAIVYTKERSTLVRGLTVRDEFRLRLVDSEQEMQDAVGETVTLVLGLTLPPEFHQAAGSGQVVQVDGYVPHWADPAEVGELVAFFEKELEKASWQTIDIDVEGHAAYPPLDSGGQPFMVSMNLSIIMLVIGLSLVPHLLVEEKETHTFEALMVSPARFSQVVIGKALAGMFYCLCAALIVFVLNGKMFVHWDVIILAVVLGAALAVAAGLLIGARCENPATINLWMGLTIMFLLIPVLLENLSSSKLPGFVRAIVPWVPSVAFSKLIGFSMAGDLSAAPIWPNAAALAGATLILLGFVVWQVRRSDR
jgi:ABC-2 type transport system permease protein